MHEREREILGAGGRRMAARLWKGLLVSKVLRALALPARPRRGRLAR
jgi:hypothetical protein